MTDQKIIEQPDKPEKAEMVYYAVPATVLAEILSVLNQLPRGQINQLALQIEQCKRVGEG